MAKVVTPYGDQDRTKKEQVEQMFDNIAPTYDFLNHFLSAGIDRRWRRKAVDSLAAISPQTILDLATGTGDFAVEALRLHPAKVIGGDISDLMMNVGRQKAQKLNVTGILEFQRVDSENMPFEDNKFDAITVGFGVRNFENLEKGLGEMHRVLRPGGRVAILEVARPKQFPMRQVYGIYFHYVLPFVGRIFSSDVRAYTYLPESVTVFPEGDDFTAILKKGRFPSGQLPALDIRYMRFLYVRKIILSILMLVTLCGAGQAQDASTVSCLLCRQAQFSAVDKYFGGDHHGYKPPHKVDPWGKIMNWYRPQGDEAGDREGFNVHELGRKLIYFGIALGVNAANYRIVRKPYTGNNDTIRTIRPGVGPGFNLGIIANWQFSKHFDLRFIPTLSFADRSIKYTTTLRQNPDTVLPISSIYLDFPLQIRFKSDPIKNVRVYCIAGVRYDYDLASNSSARTNSLIKAGKTDAAAEYGIGLMIYFPYFIMSPEFKVSQGFLNVNSPTQNFIYSTVIQKLYSRTYTFTLNLEG